MINFTLTQGDPGELAGGEPNGKCWGGYYCPAGSDQPDFIITDPGYYAYNGSSTQTECEQVFDTRWFSF